MFNLIELHEGSFFGDYQILFEMHSNFSYVADPSAKEDTWCMSCNKDTFLMALVEFPNYQEFLTNRALMRRNHFKKTFLDLKDNYKKFMSQMNPIMESDDMS